MKGNILYVNPGNDYCLDGILMINKGDDRRKGTDKTKPLKTMNKAIEKVRK